MLDAKIATEFGSSLLEQGLAPGEEHEMDAGGGNLAGELSADAGRGTGDQGPWSEPAFVKPRFHRRLSPLTAVSDPAPSACAEGDIARLIPIGAVYFNVNRGHATIRYRVSGGESRADVEAVFY